MPTIDVHQHLWPQPLIDVLAARTAPPAAPGIDARAAGRRRVCEVDLGAHDVDARIALLDRNEIDVAVISLAPTLGYAELPEDDARELTRRVRDRDPRARRVLERPAPRACRATERATGFVGTCVAAPELADLDALATDGSTRSRRRGAFLFVHPGAARPPAEAPDWWAAVVDYTAQMQAAYASWLADRREPAGRSSRSCSRCWPAAAPSSSSGSCREDRPDGSSCTSNVFFETSSYGRRAIELCLSTFGVDSLVFGSDAPVIEPETTLDAVRGFGDAVATALCDVNPKRLLQ